MEEFSVLGSIVYCTDSMSASVSHLAFFQYVLSFVGPIQYVMLLFLPIILFPYDLQSCQYYAFEVNLLFLIHRQNISFSIVLPTIHML